MSKTKKSSTPKRWQTDEDDVERGNRSARWSQSTPTSQRRAPPSPQDLDVSPAGTFDTALTSPSTFDESNHRSAPTPQKITFEHNVKSTGGGARGAGMIMGMSRPALGIASLLLLGAGGAAAFGWFQIPGLTSQIEKLEAQVAMLSGEIDRLSAENDRYESLNQELNQTVEEFRGLNEHLNSTVAELDVITADLNTTQTNLVERVTELVAENKRYEDLNNELSTTAAQLAQEVEFFESALTKLVLENGALANLTESLRAVTSELGNITDAQNETLAGLYTVLNGLTAENDRLVTLNQDLVTVVSFLNATSLGLDNSLQQITGFLAEQITANRELLTGSLENTYRQRIQAWDCAYRDFFREQPFGTDFNVIISDLGSVIDYVDQRVLLELCLDRTDFEEYLDREFSQGVTSFGLIRGVGVYTASALDFYFPKGGQAGVSAEEWAAASYNCRNLPTTFAALQR